MFHLRPKYKESAAAGKYTVGFVVVLESLPAWIPVELSFELHRHVVKQARRARPVRDFNRSDGLLTRPDAVEPVAVVILALVQVHFVGSDDRGDDFWIAGRERLVVFQLRHRIAVGDRLVAS